MSRGHKVGSLLYMSTGLAALASSASSASAQTTRLSETQTPASQARSGTSPATSDVSQIVVTGVRGQPRSKLDSPTPVDVISGKDLVNAGHSNLYQDMQLQVPSF